MNQSIDHRNKMFRIFYILVLLYTLYNERFYRSMQYYNNLRLMYYLRMFLLIQYISHQYYISYQGNYYTLDHNEFHKSLRRTRCSFQLLYSILSNEYIRNCREYYNFLHELFLLHRNLLHH